MARLKIGYRKRNKKDIFPGNQPERRAHQGHAAFEEKGYIQGKLYLE